MQKHSEGCVLLYNAAALLIYALFLSLSDYTQNIVEEPIYAIESYSIMAVSFWPQMVIGVQSI